MCLRCVKKNMCSHKQIKQAFFKIQIIPQSKTHFCKVLAEVYKEADFEEFVEHFTNCLKIAFYKDIKNVYVEQIMCFAATFSVHIAQKSTKKRTDESPRSQETDIFLKRVLSEVLPMQCYKNHNVRFHVCNFIAIVLDIMGDEDLIEENICCYIQELMIERLRDIKPAVRIKAIATLFRLQDPKNDKCPIINAFLQCLYDPNVEVRKAVIEKIAPSKFTLPKLIESLGDISEKVRAAAFKKCSVLPPNYLKITQRQEVLQRGFEENCRVAKKAFTEVLFPKWLSYHDTNFLQLLKAIKLDADEEDIMETSSLGDDIMKEVFRLHSIDTIISFLPINEDKLVPIGCLSSEIVLYWSAIHQYIASNNNLDEYLEQIVPNLFPFCTYIESILSEKDFNDSELIQWKVLENQFIIYKLFEMAGNFDLADEVGRIKLHQLVLDCLSKQFLTKPVVSTLIKVLRKLNSDANSLIEEVNELITNIIDSKKIPSLDYINERTLQLQKLVEQINRKSEELDASINHKDMSSAFELEEELKTLISSKSQIQNEPYVCDSTQELFIQNKCLDILIALLGHKDINSLTPTLITLKDIYLKSLVYEDIVIYQKIYTCCALYSLIDFETAKESLKIMCAPIVLYQDTCDYDQETLLISIYTITDLLKIHGPELFVDERLDYDTNDKEYPFLKNIIEEIINMLDDEQEKIREYAAVAISQLLYNGIMVTSIIFARILLKWYNPEMEKTNPKGQQLFGIAIEHFVKTAKEGNNVAIEAVIPTLNAISRAPVSTINVDNLIKFLAAITQIRKIEHIHLHNLLNEKLCSKILENTDGKAVNLYVKMLLSLKIPKEENILNVLKGNIEAIIESSSDTQMKAKLKKYLIKLDRVNDNAVVASIDSNPDDNQLHDNDSCGDYTIQDTDESNSPESSKRTINTRRLLANSDIESEHEIDNLLETAIVQLEKKIKLEDDNSNEVIEIEDDYESACSTSKRQNNTPMETDPEKKLKLASEVK